MKILFSNLPTSAFSPQLISILLIILLLFSDNYFVGAVDPVFQNCSVPRYCGDQLISFPFYTEEEHKHCGFPGFQLFCKSKANNGNSSTTLEVKFYGDNHIVRNIFYENQSLIVSNAAFSRQNSTSCFPTLRNLSLPSEFTLASNQNSKVFLLQNCNSSSDLLEYRIGCSAENNNNSVLAFSEEDKNEVAKASEECGNGSSLVVDLPVMKYNSDNEEMEEVLSRGFLLNWIASDCSDCNKTRGKCGFNYTTYHFKCYCSDRPHSAKCDPPGDNNFRLKWGLSIGLSLPVICLLIFLFLWRRKQKRTTQRLSRNISDPYMNSDPEGGSVCYGVHVFSYKDLEEATNNFDSEKELGDGGFGTVYHGKLKDGRDVAVKRLYEHNYKRVEQFKNEVEILTRLRHKNLVSLYGCTSRRCRELLLVYEYIPNGTVADHLHGDRAQTSPLTWPVRMSIAIETATALAYLHASDIVHRDVKTNNILLDDNFCVKVADFGLSRLFPSDVTHVSTAPQGTPGYVDPEYHQSYQLTSKSDVYSFGVVLVELISSMPAVDITRHRHEINLSNLAISKIKKRAYNELVDLRLGFESNIEAKSMTIAVAELAFQCLQQDKEMRPSMDEVLEELKRIENRNNESENHEKGFDCVTTSEQPPPSPECHEVGLLKRMNEQPPSPNTVIENWPSSWSSSTPNISG